MALCLPLRHVSMKLSSFFAHKINISLTDKNQTIQFHSNESSLIEEACRGTNN